MQFSTLKALSAIFLFSSMATAQSRNGCMCLNGDAYDPEMTQAACDLYSKNGRGSRASYDYRSEQCVSRDTRGYISDRKWHDACVAVAERGWPCRDSTGGCYSDPRAANIWCQN